MLWTKGDYLWYNHDKALVQREIMDSGPNTAVKLVDNARASRKRLVMPRPRLPKSRRELILVVLSLIVLAGALGLIYQKYTTRSKDYNYSKANDQINNNVGYDSLKNKPKNAKDAKYLGNLYLSRKQYNDARAAYNAAILFDGKDAEAYSLIATAYEREGNKEQAKKNYQKAVNMYTTAGDINAQQIMLYRLGDLDQDYKNVVNQE